MKKRICALLLAALLTAALIVPSAAASASVRFSDVSDSGLVKTVEALRLMGVMDGYSNGQFQPDTQVTRAQFCKMMVCVMDAEDELGSYRAMSAYPDVGRDYWAASYIYWAAVGKGILSGFSDGRFRPDQAITLAQASAALLRVLGYESGVGTGVQGYVTAASANGLLDGIENSDGNSPLTRKEAARLFLNLLNANCQGSGSFLSSIGLEAIEDAVLISSSATGPDGKDNALLLSTGQIYQMANERISNGSLNGCKGTLVLKNGKAVTFLPDSTFSSKNVILSSASQTQIVDSNGGKYSIEADTGIYYNGKQQTWNDAYSWLKPGASLMLCLNSAGSVEYAFVGGGDTPNEAVIVYKKGSTDGFNSLAGGAAGYTIFKNGCATKAGDMRPYDVATYSSTTNSIRVCDIRLTGYYEACEPSPNVPTSITVLGHEFPVLTTAQETLSRFKPGDQITLLLTEDNQVAGAVKPGTSGASANAVGVVTSISDNTATVDLLCGISITGKTYLNNTESNLTWGQLVRVTSSQKNSIGLSRLGGGVSGALDVTARTLGKTNLAENVAVFQYTSDGLQTIPLSDLGGGSIPASQISYARINWAGRVDILVVGGGSNTVFYGRTSVTMEESSDPESDHVSYYLEVYNDKGSMGPFRLINDIPGGVYVQATSNASGTAFTSLKELNKLGEVPNTAWSGREAVTVNGRTYTVPLTVSCYNRDNGTWLSLDAAHAYADKANLYASDDGVIRIIEVKTR